MRIGVPKEIKIHEYRVGMTPAGVRELTRGGHEVLVQHQAGFEAGFDDAHYQAAGALIVPDAPSVWKEAELIVKVKEPQPSEIPLIQSGQILFLYLHLAAEPALTRGLLDAGCTALAYETVMTDDGHLPLLAPMSVIAGRMAVHAGARCLERGQGGRGMLLSGAPGVSRAKVVVLGGGVVGYNAARLALGLEARVTILERSLQRLSELDALFQDRLQTLYSNEETVEEMVREADLVIGAVLQAGAPAPKLLHEDLVAAMQRGSAFVDVAIDQGGCSTTSRPTTHDAPTYVVDEVVHYCVTNMPGAVPHTSTFALTNATFPYVKALVDKGVDGAIEEDGTLARGLNIRRGQITHPAVAAAFQQKVATS
jgi:alanine dehydrogenase